MTQGTTTPVVSIRPVDLDGVPARISAPSVGTHLPVVVFSHGFGAMGVSMDSYQPLVDDWTAHGLVVIQPHHPDADGDAGQDLWRRRVQQMIRIIDRLDVAEAAVPGLAGRLDRDRVAVAGHSYGAQTASVLAGAGVVGEPTPGPDPRVRAAVLLALTGTGDSLTPFARENFPFMRPDFATLTTPSLVVAGDHDDSPLSTRGPDWFTDAARLAPGVSELLVVPGGEHSLGGIAGYHDKLTTDESPERVDLVRARTTAFLTARLGGQ